MSRTATPARLLRQQVKEESARVIRLDDEELEVHVIAGLANRFDHRIVSRLARVEELDAVARRQRESVEPLSQLASPSQPDSQGDASSDPALAANGKAVWVVRKRRFCSARRRSGTRTC